MYDAVADPVGRELLMRALHGEQDQAELHLYTEDCQFIETAENTVRVSVTGTPDGHQALATVHEPQSEPTSAGRALVASWPGGEGVLFRG